MDEISFAIAEDEEIERIAMETFILEHIAAARVIWTCADGAEALRAVEKDPPDILIIDIEMPVMNGLELCEALYQKKYQGVMLIHTAYAKFSYAKQAVSLNVFDYILKPVGITELCDTLQRCVEEHLRRSAARRQKEEMESIVLDVRQYALSLMTLDTMNSRQMNLFFQTVGWSGNAHLQTWVIYFSSPSTLGPNQVCIFSKNLEWLGQNGFLVSAEYTDAQHYLLLAQPRQVTAPTKLYSQIFLFLLLIQRELPSVTASTCGSCNDYSQIASACRQLYGQKDAHPIGKQNAIHMPRRTWRIFSSKELERYGAHLSRYLQDGNPQKAAGYLERICQSDPENAQERFWELVPSLFLVLSDIWPEVDFRSLFTEVYAENFDPFIWNQKLFASVGNLPLAGCGNAFDNLLSWMENAFQEDGSLTTAAEKMGMDPSYFSRYFKKVTGKNYSEYLTEIRLRHCEELLKENPAISLDELTKACGFSSKSYFCEVFKKWKGMTVSQYVKQLL